MAQSIVEIPLSPQAQVFFVTLAGTQYQFTLIWRDAPSGGWFLDIADASSNPIVSGLPLVTGVDLLSQYAYLGIPGQLWVATDGNPDMVPTFSNLGIASHLYFVVKP